MDKKNNFMSIVSAFSETLIEKYPSSDKPDVSFMVFATDMDTVHTCIQGNKAAIMAMLLGALTEDKDLVDIVREALIIYYKDRITTKLLED